MVDIIKPLSFLSLVNRQKQWAKDEDERIKSIPDPDMPPGHKVMPKDEQQQTLKKLKESELFVLCLIMH